MAAAVGAFTLGAGQSESTGAPSRETIGLSSPDTTLAAPGDESPPSVDPTLPGPSTPATPAESDSRPVQVSVPAIGVDAPVTVLGLRSDRSLEVPATAHETGWWSGGSVPGTPGPAVIAGHVNLGEAEGVFAHLAELETDDEVQVTLDAGETLRFRVDRVERHAKDSFPTQAVYGRTAGAELRLVTCGGAFDSSSGHYLDNVIAFATLVS